MAPTESYMKVFDLTAFEPSPTNHFISDPDRVGEGTRKTSAMVGRGTFVAGGNETCPEDP
jgi:hypothetical protein